MRLDPETRRALKIAISERIHEDIKPRCNAPGCTNLLPPPRHTYCSDECAIAVNGHSRWIQKKRRKQTEQ